MLQAVGERRPAAAERLAAGLITQDMVSSGDIDVTDLDTVAGAACSARSWMPKTVG